ncbi:MAG: DUF4326 domain-containing protein [Candidatus Thiodiazotropha weberae]|nr:DUF4326 domain-containing protein [Candidatus Thiodiazotropha lotti]MCG8010101.1 DUF4326 domain-containing protein [Candidatus Thiodiazotropha lotti]MCW4209559.1 DUF4326 domain-containing protein [Candidatus Thiodiazotropha lotti]MCW4216742.1 DUF4326 domain-containing protein [Candidatus Thiodiazotropha lotti]
MKVLFIAYPALFKCQTKFDRKVSKIISRMMDYKVVYADDPNSYIERHFESAGIQLEKIDDPLDRKITHAIIFDDGEEFAEILPGLEEKGVVYRLIHIRITRVVNIKRETKYKGIKSTDDYEYIGRGSYWGNPYAIGEDGDDRAEVIRKFKYDFDYEKFPTKERSEVFKLAGKRLGCFCKPEACHGDVLADFLNSYDDGQ